MSQPQQSSASSSTSASADDAIVRMARAFANLAVSSLKVKKFSGKVSENIEDWLRDLEYAANASGWSADQILLKLPLYLEGTALDLYELELRATGMTWDTAKDVLRRNFLPTNHKVYLFEEIMKTKQEPSESVTAFITRMRRKIQRWKQNCPVADMINFITSGLLPSIRQGIKQFPSADNIADFTELCVRQEDAMKERAGGKIHAVMEDSINHVSQPEKPAGLDFGSVLKDIRDSIQTLTTKVDTQVTKIDANCQSIEKLAKEVTFLKRRNNNQRLQAKGEPGKIFCYNCAQEGHKVPDCPHPKRSKEEREAIIKKSRQSSVSTVHQDRVNSLIYAQVTINNHIIEGMIDSGACRTILPVQTARLIGLKYDPCYEMPFVLGDGSSKLQILGKTYTRIMVSSGDAHAEFCVEIYITSCTGVMLLGIDAIKESGMIIYGGSKTISFPSERPVTFAHLMDAVEYEYALKASSQLSMHCIQNRIIMPSETISTLAHISGENDKQSSPLINLRNDDLIISQVVAVNNNVVKVSVSNDGDEPLELLSGELFATSVPQDSAVPVEDVILSSTTFGEVKIGAKLDSYQRDLIIDLLNEFAQLFPTDPLKIGKCDLVTHKIELSDSTPISINPYRYSQPQREEIDRQVALWLEMGVVEPSKSPWNSPLHLVHQNDKIRLVLDPRAINKVTKKVTYPFNSVDNVIEDIGSCEFIAKMDCNNGYLQVAVEPAHKEITAFSTANGHYQFCRVPFGLVNAPATFLHLMDIVLAGLKYKDCLVYMDDIIVYANDFDVFLDRLKKVLTRFRSANLTLKSSKCCFGLDRVKILGYVVSKNGIEADPDKISAINAFTAPTSIRQLQSFLGLVGFYRRLIKDFSKTARPLHDLLKKPQRFHWDDKKDEAFRSLKKSITEAPVLAHFEPHRNTRIHTDASLIGVAAILYQQHGEIWRVIHFASRTLLPAERNYYATERECLAIIFALKKFRTYIYGLPFEIVTDCCPLCWLQTKRELPSRLIRWSTLLNEHNLKVVYKTGKSHTDADCLSRNPVTDDQEPIVNELDKLQICAVITENDRIRSAQMNDSFCRQIIQALESSDEEQNQKYQRKFCLHNDKLYRLISVNDVPKLVLAVPKSMRREVFDACHTDFCAGHMGNYKTIMRCRERYYWPGMMKYIKKRVKSCHECQIRNPSNLQKAGLMVPIEVGGPFEKMGIDILGPFATSTAGNKYVVVAIDYLTKWAETKAIIDQTANQVATFYVQQIVLRHGSPVNLLSDRGTNFLSEMFEAALTIVGTRHLYTTAFHPQTNGLCERLNGTLAKILSKYVSADHSDWDVFLPFATFAYNTSYQASTRYSPFELVYGRTARLPSDVGTQIDTLGVKRGSDYLDMLQSHLQESHENARLAIVKAQTKQKGDYDKNRRSEVFVVGDQVTVWTPIRKVGLSEKLLNRWIGPFRVIRVAGPLVYELESLIGRKRVITAHISRLRKYFEDEESESSDSDATIILDYNEEPARPSSPPLHSVSPSRVPLPEIQRGRPRHEPRRSGRERRNPDRLGYSTLAPVLFLGLFMLPFLSNCNAQPEFPFPSTNPVMWKQSVTPAIEGILNTVISVRYESPCVLLKKNTHEFHWCMESFHTLLDTHWSFCNNDKPLAAFNTSLGLQTSKRKRAVALIALGTMLIGIISSIGISIRNEGRISSLDYKTDQADSKLRELEALAAQSRHAEMKFIALLKVIKKQQEAIDLRINEIVTTMNELEFNIEDRSRLYAYLGSVFSVHRIQLAEIGAKWKQGQLSHHFLELFNLTTPCHPHCPIELAKPISCKYEAENWYTNRVVFWVQFRKTSEKVLLLESHPFRLASDKTKTEVCHQDYIGPRYALIDKETHCVERVPEKYVDEGILAVPSKIQCQLSADNLTSKWDLNSCQLESETFKRRLVQIKPALQNVFVYCYLSKIKVDGKELDCPNYPFSLPAKLSIKIGDYDFSAKHLNVTSDGQYVPEWSQRVNLQFYTPLPSIQEQNSDVDFNLDEPDVILSDAGYPLDRHSLTAVSLMATALLLLVMYLVHQKIFRTIVPSPTELSLSDVQRVEANIDAVITDRVADELERLTGNVN